MINIDFKVDKDFIAREIISTSTMPVEFANYLWEKYRSSYTQLKNDRFSTEINPCIIYELQSQDFFNKIIQDANNNLNRIELNWLNKKSTINSFLQTICKTNINLQNTAYIFPTYFNNGYNIGKNRFVWGHRYGMEDPNYDLVYLIHESLHSYPEFCEMDTSINGNISHAIIENITDIELAKYLSNNKTIYSCHNFTKDTHSQIQPYWDLYLNKSPETIDIEQQYYGTYYNHYKYESLRPQISQMNINEFTNFVKHNVNLHATNPSMEM